MIASFHNNCCKNVRQCRYLRKKKSYALMYKKVLMKSYLISNKLYKKKLLDYMGPLKKFRL